MPQIVQWKFRKYFLIVRKWWKKMFCQNIFLNGYVPLGLKKAFLTTIPKMIQRKNQKMFPGYPTKMRKVKFLSKIIFQLPIWRQIVQILVPCCKSSAAKRTFSRPKSIIVYKVNTMFLSTCSSGHVRCIFDDFVAKFWTKLEKFWLKYHTKLKKKVFEKIIPQKVLGHLECNFDKTDETFFSEVIFFSLEHEVKWNMTKFCKKNRKYIWTRRMQFWQPCWNFSHRSGRLSLKVRQQFWKIRKK